MAPRNQGEALSDTFHDLNLLNSLKTSIDTNVTAATTTTKGTTDSTVTRDVKQKDVPVNKPVGRPARIIILMIVIACVLYKNQNLNIFLLCDRMIHLLVFPIVSLRDIDTPTNKPTTVEYDVQTYAIVGLLSYTISLLLLYMSTSNPIIEWISSFNVSQAYIAICIAAGFESGGRSFESQYCSSFAHANSKTIIDRVYEQLTLPLCLLCLVGLQNIDQLVEYNNYIRISITVSFAYRMSLLLNDYNKAQSTLTESTANGIVSSCSAERSIRSGPMNPPGHENVWRIYGNEYDVTDFVKSHPGGVESIMLGANREDCTAMFQSYHAFSIHKAKSVLAKYRISSSATTSTTTPEDEKKLQGSYPIGHHNDLFYEELVKRVSKKLLDNGIDPIKDRYASWGRYFVYATLTTCTIISGYYHLTGSLLGSFLFGVSYVYTSANIVHDGGHFAISKIPLINDVCLWFGNGNPIIWQHEHTYAHHSYTSQDSRDPDVTSFCMLLRYNPLQTFQRKYRMQIHTLYILFSFGFANYGQGYIQPWRCIFERSIHGVVEWTDRKRWFRTAFLLIHLVAYAAIWYIIPFWFHKSSWTAALGSFIFIFTSGLIFGISTQIGHISELALNSVRDPIKAQESRHFIAKESFAATQIEATNDFCPQSYVCFMASLLLNVQIEHHIFPSLNHCHLQLIQPTVEECCLEYNVLYKKYNSFREIFENTITYIQSLAIDDTTSSGIGNKKID